MQSKADTSEAEALLREMGIGIRHAGERKKPGETYAAGRVQALIAKHGREHVWRVLYALTESENHKADLTGSVIGAISDLFLAFPDWSERLGEFMDALDRIDLSEMRAMAKSGPGPDGDPANRRTLIAAYLQFALLPLMEQPEQGELVA